VSKVSADNSAKYTVGGAPANIQKRVAVFVAHGMGQQIPFQSMDAVAHGLRQEDKDPNAAKPTARAIKPDSEWIHRIEMPLKNGTVDVHVYEAYWAPLTEGRITLRDVIRFLTGAGSNALRNSSKGMYKRWMFGQYTTFPIAIRTLFYLLVTLTFIMSLVAMNSVIVGVAAGTALRVSAPPWLTVELLGDLTSTFNGVVAAMVVTGLALAIGALLKLMRLPLRLRLLWSGLASLATLGTVIIVILAGISIPVILYAHIRLKLPAPSKIWSTVFSTPAVSQFDETVSTLLLYATIVFGGIYLLLWLGRIVAGVARDLGAKKGVWGTIAVTAVFCVIVGLASRLLFVFAGVLKSSGGSAAVISVPLVWTLLIGLSNYVRTVLVQFMGDVAIYVMPHKLDAFNDLRREIRSVSHKVLESIYRQKDEKGRHLYDAVIIVGHSLGSVVAYDALNQMIRDDELQNRTDVVDRTPLFLTFGSPLDKTAFIFSLQGHKTSEAREALAASVQPMISDYRFRPKEWVNLWSPWDIISGHLGFYDPDPPTDSRSVQNLIDREANIPIMAHVEYWQGSLVYEHIYKRL
jgi:hypothetical protein